MFPFINLIFVSFFVLFLWRSIVSKYVICTFYCPYIDDFYFFISCIPLNQVAVEVERDEDEGGMVGETFTDYVSY